MSSILNSKQRGYTIHHEVVNFSTAQSKFSFCKDRRFKSISQTTPTDFTVDMPSTFGKRSPSFGIGERFKNFVPKEKRK
jgi:hypothetical protein